MKTEEKKNQKWNEELKQIVFQTEMKRNKPVKNCILIECVSRTSAKQLECERFMNNI